MLFLVVVCGAKLHSILEEQMSPKNKLLKHQVLLLFLLSLLLFCAASSLGLRERRLLKRVEECLLLLEEHLPNWREENPLMSQWLKWLIRISKSKPSLLLEAEPRKISWKIKWLTKEMLTVIIKHQPHHCKLTVKVTLKFKKAISMDFQTPKTMETIRIQSNELIIVYIMISSWYAIK